jgi:hypothetical protein
MQKQINVGLARQSEMFCHRKTFNFLMLSNGKYFEKIISTLTSKTRGYEFTFLLYTRIGMFTLTITVLEPEENYVSKKDQNVNPYFTDSDSLNSESAKMVKLKT